MVSLNLKFALIPIFFAALAVAAPATTGSDDVTQLTKYPHPLIATF
jgi:hypothetical protein